MFDFPEPFNPVMALKWGSKLKETIYLSTPKTKRTYLYSRSAMQYETKAATPSAPVARRMLADDPGSFVSGHTKSTGGAVGEGVSPSSEGISEGPSDGSPVG